MEYEEWIDLQNTFNGPEIPEPTTLIYWERTQMDTKAIIDILKAEGIEATEDLALNAVKAAIQILKNVAPKVSEGAGAMILFFLTTYEDKILNAIDKIDGKKDLE